MANDVSHRYELTTVAPGELPLTSCELPGAPYPSGSIPLPGKHYCFCNGWPCSQP
ncbi:hypothetical protein OKW28_002998 [Paraburkholderia sp. 40]